MFTNRLYFYLNFCICSYINVWTGKMRSSSWRSLAKGRFLIQLPAILRGASNIQNRHLPEISHKNYDNVNWTFKYAPWNVLIILTYHPKRSFLKNFRCPKRFFSNLQTWNILPIESWYTVIICWTTPMQYLCTVHCNHLYPIRDYMIHVRTLDELKLETQM